MKTPTRSLLAISALVIVLAACGGTAIDTPEASDSPEPPAPSSVPSEAPSEAPDPDGTISVVNGGAVDGPGRSIADAIANRNGEPDLVNGVLALDVDGNLWLVESITDSSPSTLGGPRLRVLDYPESPEQWNLENADITGLQEADGVLYFEGAQLYGVVEA